VRYLINTSEREREMRATRSQQANEPTLLRETPYSTPIDSFMSSSDIALLAPTIPHYSPYSNNSTLSFSRSSVPSPYSMRFRDSSTHSSPLLLTRTRASNRSNLSIQSSKLTLPQPQLITTNHLPHPYHDWYKLLLIHNHREAPLL